MMSYLLHTTVLFALSFCFYWLFLSKETHFQLNRFLLLFISVSSATIPLIKIPQHWSLHTDINKTAVEQIMPVESLQLINRREFSDTTKNHNSTPSKNTSAMSFQAVIAPIYWCGVGLFFCTFLVQLVSLFKLKKKLAFSQDKSYKIYELTDDTPPFSFYQWIFINPARYDRSSYEQIIAHEKIHVNQAHFIDKLCGELALVFMWFNPFVWVWRRAIDNNLEYITDAQMVCHGHDAQSYQMNLLRVSVPHHQLNITTPYSQSTLQKRIIMMNKHRSSACSSWKYFMLTPLLLLSVSTLNATYSPKQATQTSIDLLPSGQKQHRSIISKTMSFPTNAAQNFLAVDNITGKIKVQGHAGNQIKIEVEKVVTAASDNELQRGILETQLKIIDRGKQKYLYLNSPYSTFNENTHTFSYQNNCDDTSCFDYAFELNYQISVPYQTSLKLSTVNGGDIIVTGIQGEKLVAKHISGSIFLNDMATAVTDVSTISGDITASYHKNPSQQSSYITTSGYIDVDYVTGLDADVSYQIKDGALLSDFAATAVNNKNHRHSKLKSPIRIGTGGVDLFFKTTSGDVLLNQLP